MAHEDASAASNSLWISYLFKQEEHYRMSYIKRDVTQFNDSRMSKGCVSFLCVQDVLPATSANLESPSRASRTLYPPFSHNLDYFDDGDDNETVARYCRSNIWTTYRTTLSSEPCWRRTSKARLPVRPCLHFFDSHDHSSIRHSLKLGHYTNIFEQETRLSLACDQPTLKTMMATPAPPPVVGGGMSAMTTTLNMRPHMTNAQPTPPPPSQAQPTAKAPKMGTPVACAPPPPPAPIQNEKITMPFSARHAEPLDLNSVERRGQPTQIPDFEKPSRPHELKEAPTFRPTEEEFRNPMEYIRKIAPEAKEFGICKIIPPDGWNPEFAIDTEVRLNFTWYLHCCPTRQY